MAENRYYQLLGISEDIKYPNYYQLLGLDFRFKDEAEIQDAFKSQMKRLQHIKSSKHKGFIEFLKGELKDARRTLADANKRAQYDKDLVADRLEEFKRLIEPVLSSGHLTFKTIETLCKHGVRLGFTVNDATEFISRQATELGVKLVDPTPAPAAGTINVQLNANEEDVKAVLLARKRQESMARGSKRRSESETRSERGRGQDRSQGNRKRRGESESEGGRPRGSGGPSSRTLSRQQRWKAQEQKRVQARAIAEYNRAILASKAAMARHNELRSYFPPVNRSKKITEQINGKHYSEVFEQEIRSFRESKEQFELCCKLLEKVGDSRSKRTLEIAEAHVREIESYLHQGNELKRRLHGQPTQRDEIRLWMKFVRATRSRALTSRLQLTDPT